MINKWSLFAAVCFLPGTALAGCADYDENIENAPRYLVCFGNDCDTTVQTYQCANIDSYQDGYLIGWSRDCHIGDENATACDIFWQGRRINPAKYDLISFTLIDE